ncbi:MULTISPECIES: glutathione S-transferase family protein [Pseudomonas]|uniref:glutathione S-transferase family protein n=1 Tax=Pseudomonas TaxID=286 RepID=UPI0018A9A164|nr:glutathione S-transferase family protein [Pseudomonas guariconensis]MBF8724078.1 glutathione S-transferase family protein [Pseudomonas guariconensis]MBF8740318.1 glutathione S-transferase family protein [Pseudomonas guariconensis]MBF8749632.1 glutathione S-transferase family protein [Pseudomonas guariconensis]MBF8794373.1 glutathione S-transferase family protein [Pseudomonas monteilii]
MLTVWGRERGLCVKKVLWCLEDLGLNFERIDAGRQYGRTHEEEYLRLNRNGLVPTLLDDDFVLWESNAIMRYLARQYGNDTLYPLEPRLHADVNRWLDWSMGALWPDIVPLFTSLIRTEPAKRDQAAIKVQSERIARNWLILDEYLQGKQYVTGEHFTIADIALGVLAQTYETFELDNKPDAPHLAAWYARISERPGFKRYAVLPPEQDPSGHK